jgi:TonB-linked SusC/RagA family outer membrane protein
MKKSQNDKLRIKLLVAFFACFLVAAGLPAFAQQNTVRGKVTNDAGSPINGASVVVKGTSTGTTTNPSGDFSISAPTGSTLVISSVNFLEKEVQVGASGVVNVSLAAAAGDLGEVVVIGYGTVRKRDVTGSTVSVKGETLNEIKAPNIYNQLQGRAAGVDIQNNSGNIGSSGQIRIRGNRSLTNDANNPLIVVDGMAYGGSLNDLSPENIASIDILKDASATAIFGSRGASGVIIITTKRGGNQKAITTYNGYVGISSVIDTWRLFTGQEYAQFKADAGVGNSNAANPSPATNPYALTSVEQANLAAGVNTDWQNLALTTGIRTSHDVGVRGGNERTQFYFGLGYYRETGVIPDQEFNRYSLNVNIDHKMSERIKVGFSSFTTLNRSNRTGSNGAFNTRIGPLYKPYNDDGTMNYQPAILQGVDNTQLNPLTNIGNDDLLVAFTRRMQLQNNFYGELKILKDLKFRTSFGFGWSQTVNNNYNGQLQFPGQTLTTAQATLSQNNSEGWQYTINNSLEYTKTFAGKHKLQAQALQEVQKNWFRAQQFNGTGVPADFMQDYNWLQVNAITPQGGNFNERALIGYMGRAIYSFDDKYVLTATVRTDASSVLAPGHQWVTYPAVSAAWNLDREKFMSNVSLVNSLKLRAGWGISSNQNINPYQTLGTLGTNFYNFGSGNTIGTNYVAGYLAGNAPNPELTWEKSAGFNIGVDFAILNNRLSGSIEYFDIRTTDILLSKNLPQSTGLTAQQTNIGKTKTTGMEFTLSSVNVQSKGGFTWNTDFNIFFSREKIVQLTDPNLKVDISNGWFVGQPISVIFDYKKLGIWQTSEAAQATVYGVKPGDIKLEDVNKDNVINAADRQIIGNFQPDFVAGMTNHFAYKNFDLNIVMFGRLGQKVVATYLSADGGAAGYPFFMNSRVQQLKVDYWTPTNPTNAFPQPDAGRDALMYTSTLSYQNGSFIKIRTIDLGYNFSSRLLNKAGIQSLRAYVSAQNPFILWSPMVRDNLGIDPEGNGTGNSIGTQGGGVTSVPNNRTITVGMGVPPTRQIIFGLNVRF